MTTPATTISMQDILTETGGSKPVSFNDWFVRHVAKTATVAVSMSSMRGKTCYPVNAFGMTYVGAELYDLTSGTATVWSVGNLDGGVVTIMDAGVQQFSGMTSAAFVDVGSARYFKGTQKAVTAAATRFGLRKVVG